MSTYFISDIHGCYEEFRILLEKSSFNDKKDYLWIAGDLVSRGPDSLEVVKYLYSLKDRVQIVLGNHDINLIAVHAGIKDNKKENYFDEFLSSPDSVELINWLRCQSFLKVDEKRKIIMSHAGISPQWDINIAKVCALEIEDRLSHKNYALFLKEIYHNNIDFWRLDLNQLDRLRYSMNSFTRMRYCYPDGRLNMFCKKSPDFVKYPLRPWFLMPSSISKVYSIFFGHWSSLKGTHVPKPFFPLDAGCCWGEELVMLRWEDGKWFSQAYLSKKCI
ncbi:bis(5'-nucleosyl)-tetraphosphatase (symmetrical) ApaH [Buchnera aphidicola]|uniref:Bis(5'-nucleosyl)-tetraphosphatase, symmetrical n=1 Tax=Buchnera aphidicola subsp. Acyrthosiphon pisum (strain Tuc7) TaxID=561501 RepID=APAH_BUCAT|nr:bis(5'-nucleosyl)-tetraphosphatase (symmetrical) ApaH [Buchnera aphidicola]B8D747.1 RecName: Full=Bis(5'-nucleosyl)-tetraphosphatase, symmetrical; AltName: Full=Ap4A hydrolase; AltName: Full=Diadenosine 5',5'''-P1,P4-tetraphosphate pyrophosphohydrolase; AltName: Full=Diadenosine tetraphosphatase [Buchnera aphidicola str. Tuc7 (Acyrthosiphon pisum)]ACL29962.1 bis(5'-nucleosyl)-tetraphosphatase [Buchnera aphidicola str. Tuc7 (Acyrthosiphon pisum)]